MPRTDIETMRRLAAAKLQLIPLHRWNDAGTDKAGKPRQDGKRPTDKDWTRKAYDNDNVLAKAELTGANVGVRLTPDLIVLDWDPRNDNADYGDPHVDSFVEFVLTHGLDPDAYPTVKTGSGGLHLYMAKPAGLAISGSLDGFPGVEFKTVGQQVVAPGSVHPNQRLYVLDDPFDEIGSPPAAPQAMLDAIAKPVRSAQVVEGGDHEPDAVAAMLEGLDPENFRDHRAWLEIMQACHHASAGAARAEFIEWSTSDPMYAGHEWIIGSRWDSLHAEKAGPVVTVRTLFKRLRDAGRDDLVPRSGPSAADDFLDDPVEAPSEGAKTAAFEPPQAVWRIRDGVLTEMADVAEQALADSSEKIFLRGSMLVTPVGAVQAGLPTYGSTDDDTDERQVVRDARSIVLNRVSQPHLTELLGRVVRWRKPEKATKEDQARWAAKHPGADGEPPQTKLVPCLPPKQVVETVLGRPSLSRLPRILAVFNSPVVLPDGTILQDEGYHPAVMSLVDFGGQKFPAVPDAPTREDAERALRVMMAPFEAYRFADPASRGVCASGVLTAIARPLLQTAPLHAVSSSTPGAGKTQLAQCWSIVATGAGAAVLSQSERQEELAKRLESLLIAGDRAAIIDNCSRALGGDTFNMLLTDTQISIRVLGGHDEVSVPTNVFLCATGNHFQMRGDAVRRAVVCTVLPAGPDPEAVAFDFSPKARAAAMRPEIVAAALTIIRAYHAAGRPLRRSMPALGSFEQWSRLCREPIAWIMGAEADPVLSMRAQKDGDPEAGERSEVLCAWRDAFGVGTRRQARDVAAADELSTDALLALKQMLVRQSGRDGWQGQAVGGVLTRCSERPTDGLILRKVGRDAHGAVFVLDEA
jgi:hypothetical protein